MRVLGNRPVRWARLRVGASLIVLGPLLSLALVAEVSSPAYAVAPSPTIPTLGVPGPALGTGAATTTAGDLSWLESVGIDSSSLVDVAAPASDVLLAGPAAGGVLAAVPAVGVALAGFAAGYFIGSHFTFAYNWYFGSGHTANADAGGYTGTGVFCSGLVSGIISGHDVVSGSPTTHTDITSCTPNFTTGAVTAHFASYEADGHYTGVWDSAGGGTCGGAGFFGGSTGRDLTFAAGESLDFIQGGDVSPSLTGAPRSPMSFSDCEALIQGGSPSGGGGQIAFYTDVSAPSAVSNPVRQIIVDADCMAADGTEHIVESGSAGFHELDTTYPPIPAAGCPAGDRLLQLNAVERSSGLADIPLISWIAPTDSVAALDSTYPACADPAAKCTLRLAYTDPTSGAQIDCLTDPGPCAHWLADPTKSADFSCTYGGVSTALSDCQPYAATFNPPTSTGAAAHPISAPTTTTDPPTSSPAEPDSSCPPPIHWGLSLVSPWWYFKVGQCVFSWAFIPPSGTLQTDTQTVQAHWDGSSVGTFLGGIAAVPAAFGTFGTGTPDCNGPGFNFPIPSYGDVSVHPFAACTAPMSTVAATTKTILTVVIILGTVVIISRPILLALGMPTWKLGRGDEA